MMDAKIADRVKKLLALAENTSENEAANAAAAAQALMDRHGIELAMLEEVGEADDEESVREAIGDVQAPMEPARRAPRWQDELLSSIAWLNGCRTYRASVRWQWRPGSSRGQAIWQVKLVGKLSNVEVTGRLYAQLAHTVDQIALLRCQGRGRVYGREFREGMVSEIITRMLAARRRTTEEMRKEVAGDADKLARIDAALARRKADLDEVDAWMDAELNLVSGGARYSSGEYNRDARKRGRAAGREVDLGEGGHRRLGKGD